MNIESLELNGATSIIPGSCDDPNVLALNLPWASAVDRNVDVSTPQSWTSSGDTWTKVRKIRVKIVENLH